MKLMETMKYARIPIERNVRRGGEALVVTDTDMEPLVYESVAAAASQMGADVTIAIMTPAKTEGRDFTKPLAKAMEAADVLIMVTSKSTGHTDPVRKALKREIRCLSMNGITTYLLTGGAATADYNEVERITKKMAELLNKTSQVRVTSKAGTDVSLSIEGRKATILDGRSRPGGIACFPDGEAAIAPVESTAEGTIVFDTSIQAIGPVGSHVTFKVERGRAINIRGGMEAQRLKDYLDRYGDENSRLITEFAIGTNPKARITGNAYEDKKGLGRVHMAMGDNATLGGQIRSRTHLDGIMAKPTVRLDDDIIIEDGKLMV